jgi:hypothetical protein
MLSRVRKFAQVCRRSSTVLSVVGGGAIGLFGLSGLVGCNELTGSQPLPSGTVDPSTYNTPAGALSMRNTAIYAIEQSLPFYLADAGLLTDELESNQVGASPGILSSSNLPSGGSLDERILPELTTGDGTNADVIYGTLQAVRGDVNQALSALATYDPAAPPAVRGELYALDGYAEILLADFFCSGVPLSTVDFQQDFTYHAGSTTAQVYQDAITKLDTALALSSDSVWILNLARVLKGRALLALGGTANVAAAAQAVTAVPDGFQYQLAIQWQVGQINILTGTGDAAATVSDREGGNGLPYISSGDPRTAVTNTGTSSTGAVLYFPVRYNLTSFSPFPVADWIEARLIQAEAVLQAGDVTTWLADLNQLRTSGESITTTPASTVFDTAWVTGCTNNARLCTDSVPTGTSYAGFTIDSVLTVTLTQGSPAWQVCWADAGSRASDCNNPVPVVVYGKGAVVDTSWSPGTGGVSGLSQLIDPGTDTARVSLMFQERAYWLFLTGHRQGDLRRLIRQYGRSQAQVYPIGPYNAPGAGQYGSDVTAPIPAGEYTNPLFQGCLNRGA